jgi:hypothetical protein
VFTAQSMYGAVPQAPSYGVASPTQHMATDDITTGWKGLLDFQNNPLPWLGVVLVVTVGAASLAGSVRLGKARLSASLGQA